MHTFSSDKVKYGVFPSMPPNVFCICDTANVPKPQEAESSVTVSDDICDRFRMKVITSVIAGSASKKPQDIESPVIVVSN